MYTAVSSLIPLPKNLSEVRFTIPQTWTFFNRAHGTSSAIILSQTTCIIKHVCFLVIPFTKSVTRSIFTLPHPAGPITNCAYRILTSNWETRLFTWSSVYSDRITAQSVQHRYTFIHLIIRYSKLLSVAVQMSKSKNLTNDQHSSLSTQYSRIAFVNHNRLSVNIANTNNCRHINPHVESTTVINLVHRWHGKTFANCEPRRIAG